MSSPRKLPTMIDDSFAIPNPDQHETRATALIGGHKYYKKKYVGRINNVSDEARVIAYETFSGMMMRLFLGNNQPLTLQRNLYIDRVNPVLYSQAIHFEDHSTQESCDKWINAGYKNSATLDVAEIFMAEGDGSLTNRGITPDGTLVRVDFGNCLAPLTLERFFNTSKLRDTPKTYRDTRQYDEARKLFYSKTIPTLSYRDGYEISSEDLASLPLIADLDLTSNPDAVKTRYMPVQWWANEPFFNRDSLKRLQTDPTYLRDKHRAMLEKTILPDGLIKMVADTCYWHPDDKKQVIAFMLARKKKMQQEVMKVPSYKAYSGSNEFRDDKKLLETKFSTFMREYLNSIPAPLPEPAPTPTPKSKPRPTLNRYLRAALIGAAVTLGALVVAAAAVAIVAASWGTAAVAIGAFAATVYGTLTLAGTIGVGTGAVVTGAGIATGASRLSTAITMRKLKLEAYHSIPSPSNEPTPSTLARNTSDSRDPTPSCFEPIRRLFR